MKLSMPLIYAGNPRETADEVAGLEKAGLDGVWVAEAYSFDAITLMGYLAAKTETVEIGAGIVNVYSRTPGALLAMTAAGLDYVSGGRRHLRPRRVRAPGHRGLPRRAVRQARRSAHGDHRDLPGDVAPRDIDSTARLSTSRSPRARAPASASR